MISIKFVSKICVQNLKKNHLLFLANYFSLYGERDSMKNCPRIQYLFIVYLKILDINLEKQSNPNFHLVVLIKFIFI